MGTPTDNTHVDRSDDPMQRRLDEILAALPPSFVVAAHGSARFVVGPSGAFVLLPGSAVTDGVAGAATHLDSLVQTTRAALCDHLSWVPFLDALLVTQTDFNRPAPVTTVPLDLLTQVVTEGPVMVDPAAIASIRSALRADSLNGWRVGSGDDAARIDLCDPAQPTTTH